MATVNSGDVPKNSQEQPTPMAKPENSADISINFTPRIEITAPPKDAPQQPATEKKSLLAGLFAKKEATSESQPLVTQPSKAWSNAPDVPTEKKPAAPVEPADAAETKPPVPLKPQQENAAEPSKDDFFTSAALEEKSGASKLIENIATQKARLEEPKIEELLGKKSTILESSIEQEAIFKLKKKLRVSQFLAFFVAVVAVAVNGFLFYQLSPGVNVLGLQYNFESNLRNDLFNLNENLRSMQTELSKYQYLAGQLYLNQFGYESTRFIDSVAKLEETSSAGDRTVLSSVIEEAEQQMPVLLAGAKQNLTQPVVVETYPTRGEEVKDPTMINLDFQNALRQAINEEKNAFQRSVTDNGPVNNVELAFYDNTIKLVGNLKLLENLGAMTVEAFQADADAYVANNDPAQRQAFRSYIDNLLASTKVNLATITNLRNSRIKWSEVLDRLEAITSQVNTEHNSGLGAGNASSITYSSYDFNADTGAIGINAINSTRSGTNREVVTYLIEALEASPEFKNVSNRNFPLSRTLDAAGVETYTMSFKIDMQLEKGAFSRDNSPIEDLQNGPQVASIKVPVKRKQ